MSSQINVDTIVDKAGSGGTNVKIANTSVTVAEGGSATTTTVQGLCKSWSHHSGAGSISDSFNCSHTTDHGSNDNTFSFTNNMGNGTYSVTFGGGQNGATSSFVSYQISDGLNTGSFRFDGGYHDGNGPHNYEWEDNCFQVQGDLA